MSSTNNSTTNDTREAAIQVARDTYRAAVRTAYREIRDQESAYELREAAVAGAYEVFQAAVRRANRAYLGFN